MNNEGITPSSTGLPQEDLLRLLQLAMAQSPASVVVTDLLGVIVYVNPEACQTTGYSEAELVGTHTRLLRSGMQPPEFYKKLWTTIRVGEVWRGEFHNRRKDGTLFWERASICGVRNAAGEITHYMAVKEDVTAEKDAEEKLREAKEAADAASRAKDAFLANMSHELRTPLNAINGLTQTLIEQECLPEQKASLELIRQAGQDLLGIIQDVLFFSSLQTGRFIVELKPTDLVGVLMNAVRLVASQAEKKQLNLSYWVDPALPASIETDGARLQQILVNLLANAVKFTEKGRIHVALRDRGIFGHDRQIDFIISDTGIGIEAKVLDRLFQPFSQADASTTRRYGGAGLGLAISRSLARSLNGDIHVKTREGRGSAFTLSLVVPQVADDTKVFDRPRATLVGVKVAIAAPLIVERDWLALVLSGAGATIISKDAELPRDLPADVVRIDACTRPLVRVRDEGGEHPGSTSGILRWPVMPDALIQAVDKVSSKRRTVPPVPPKLDRPGLELPLRILAADDIRTNIETLRIMLKHLGFSDVVLVDDGLKAVEAASSKSFDLILMDLHMPRMDGITAARQIRAAESPDRPRAKIIALTASTLQSDRDLCAVAGMDDYLTKPVLPVSIAAMIRKHFADRFAPAGEKAKAPGKESECDPLLPWIDETHIESILSSLGEVEGLAMIDALAISLKSDFEQILENIEKACAVRDTEGLGTLIHGLKGAALTTGWLRLGTRCAQELKNLRAGTFNRWAEWPDELRSLAQGSLRAWENRPASVPSRRLS